MHIIIGGTGRRAEDLGGKGLNLLRLDALGLTPDFILISTDVLRRAASRDPVLASSFRAGAANPDPGLIRRRLLALPGEEALLGRLRRALLRLGPGPLIFRSSFVSEDSAGASYAGIFESGVYRGRFDAFAAVKKIWAGQYGANALQYRRGDKTAPPCMAVVIQKFLKPEHSGVCFYDASTRELYAEYCSGSHDAVELGKTRPAVYLRRRGQSYSSLPGDGGSPAWLEELAGKVSAFTAAARSCRLDIEFAVTGGKVSLLQSRPLTTSFNPGGQYYAISAAAGANCSPEDFSLAAFRDILAGLRLPVPSDIRKGPGGALLSGDGYFKLADALDARAADPRFPAVFRRKYLAFLLSACSRLSSLEGESSAVLFADLKRIGFRMSIYDLLLEKLRNNLEAGFRERYGTGWLEENIGRLVPDGSFTASRLSVEVLKGSAMPLFYSDKEVCGVLRGGALAVELRKLAAARAGRAKAPGLRGFAAKYAPALRDLVDLKDRVDYYYAMITSVYHKRISISTGYGGDISELCRLPAAGISAFLAGKRPVMLKYTAARAKGAAPVFPLAGIVACRGEVRGRAVVINKFLDIAKVKKGNILVARYTKPDLVMGMVLAGGIITAEGGLTSHAAIVARELKKPCLVGVEGCMRAIKSGDLLTIRDGKVFRR